MINLATQNDSKFIHIDGLQLKFIFIDTYKDAPPSQGKVLHAGIIIFDLNWKQSEFEPRFPGLKEAMLTIELQSIDRMEVIF